MLSPRFMTGRCTLRNHRRPSVLFPVARLTLSLDVGGQDPSPMTWSIEHYGPWPDAGWITDEEALAFIEKGAKLFRETTTTKGEKPP